MAVDSPIQAIFLLIAGYLSPSFLRKQESKNPPAVPCAIPPAMFNWNWYKNNLSSLGARSGRAGRCPRLAVALSRMKACEDHSYHGEIPAAPMEVARLADSKLVPSAAEGHSSGMYGP